MAGLMRTSWLVQAARPALANATRQFCVVTHISEHAVTNNVRSLHARESFCGGGPFPGHWHTRAGGCGAAVLAPACRAGAASAVNTGSAGSAVVAAVRLYCQDVGIVLTWLLSPRLRVSLLSPSPSPPPSRLSVSGSPHGGNR